MNNHRRHIVGGDKPPSSMRFCCIAFKFLALAVGSLDCLPQYNSSNTFITSSQHVVCPILLQGPVARICLLHNMNSYLSSHRSVVLHNSVLIPQNLVISSEPKYFNSMLSLILLGHYVVGLPFKNHAILLHQELSPLSCWCVHSHHIKFCESIWQGVMLSSRFRDVSHHE